MADSLRDIMSRRNLNEPAEIAVIKRFLRDHYRAAGKVAIRENQIIIVVASAALAGALRLRLPELQELAQTKKKLVIRIGQ
jgi:hypothetical protein